MKLKTTDEFIKLYLVGLVSVDLGKTIQNGKIGGDEVLRFFYAVFDEIIDNEVVEFDANDKYCPNCRREY